MVWRTSLLKSVSFHGGFEPPSNGPFLGPHESISARLPGHPRRPGRGRGVADVDDEVRDAELERRGRDRLAVRPDHRRHVARTDLHVSCNHTGTTGNKTRPKPPLYG